MHCSNISKSLLATKLVADICHLGGSALCRLTAMNYSAKHNYGNNYCRNMLGCITQRHPYHCRQLEYRKLECKNATTVNWPLTTRPFSTHSLLFFSNFHHKRKMTNSIQAYAIFSRLIIDRIFKSELSYRTQDTSLGCWNERLYGRLFTSERMLGD